MQKVLQEDLPAVVRSVLARLPNSNERTIASIITLSGELGAGKTTFTKALARVLGVTDTVQSPTYVLMKSYPIAFEGFTTLVHIDAYRLEKPEEFMALKPDSFLNNKDTLVVVEWPERLEGVLPAPHVEVRFWSDGDQGAASDQERYIEIV